MASAWIFQKPEHLRKFGPNKAPWYVGWYEPDGRRRKKSCGPGFKGKKNAEHLKSRTEDELTRGTYEVQVQTKKTWDEFVKEYEEWILGGLASRSRSEALSALAHFKRLAKPRRVSSIMTARIDGYVAARRQEKGMQKGIRVSPATVNKELRHIKAALNVALDWGYLAKAPRFRMEKEPGKLPTYVRPEHLAAIYVACDQARWPEGQTFTPADWWRALIVTAYMTGWRIGQLLAIRRDDLNLDLKAGTGTVKSRAKDNKGKRDQFIPLHRLAVEHLGRLAGFSPEVFPWNHGRRQVFEEFVRLQEAAGIRLAGERGHYGFHDLRRAFATMNADKVTADVLQALMQHKDYQTTQRYINMARQLNPAVAELYEPTLPKLPEAGSAS